MTILASGCVTLAEQTASQSDLNRLRRAVGDSRLSQLDPESFIEDARVMVATSIDFYGEVLDEEGRPLEGAEIEPVVFDRLIDPFEFPFFAFTAKPTVRSDMNGRFRIHGLRGAGMYLKVTVPGYKPVDAARRLFVYASALRKGEPPPDREAPATFVFEPRPPETELRRISTGALPLPRDGEPLPVVLRRPAPYGPDPGEEEATVTCGRVQGSSETTPGESAPYDWSCELRIAGGGAQALLLGFDRAPEDGYEETLRFSVSASDPRWDDRDDRDLILRFADGNYGFVKMQMRMGGDRYVAFEGLWNATGSTWLD